MRAHMCARACVYVGSASLRMALSKVNIKWELMVWAGALRCDVGMPHTYLSF